MKKKAFNYCMLVFAMTYIKLSHFKKDLSDPETFANAQHEPNGIATAHRMLFAKMKQKGGITFSLEKDFNYAGKQCDARATARAANLFY